MQLQQSVFREVVKSASLKVSEFIWIKLEPPDLTLKFALLWAGGWARDLQTSLQTYIFLWLCYSSFYWVSQITSYLFLSPLNIVGLLVTLHQTTVFPYLAWYGKSLDGASLAPVWSTITSLYVVLSLFPLDSPCDLWHCGHVFWFLPDEEGVHDPTDLISFSVKMNQCSSLSVCYTSFLCCVSPECFCPFC